MKRSAPVMHDRCHSWSQDLSLIFSVSRTSPVSSRQKRFCFQWIIPLQYEYLQDYENGRFIADVEVNDNNCKLLLSQTGSILACFDDMEWLNNEYLIVCKNDLCGLIDKDGTIVLPLIYDQMEMANMDTCLVRKSHANG